MWLFFLISPESWPSSNLYSVENTLKLETHCALYAFQEVLVHFMFLSKPGKNSLALVCGLYDLSVLSDSNATVAVSADGVKVQH